MPWYLYLLECENGSIYTGIAVNVEERYDKHLRGKGARYTRANPPKKILASVRYANRSLASKAEYAMKCLTAAEKRAFCKSALKKRKRSSRLAKPKRKAA